MFVLTLLFEKLFKSKSYRNLVTKVATKPEFLVTKEKMLVALVTISVTISSPAVSVTLSHTFDVNQRSLKLTFCPVRSMGQ